MIHCNSESRLASKAHTDPDPITVAAFVVATTTMAVSVSDLLYRISEAREDRIAKRRRARAIVRRAMGIAESLKEDIRKFDEMCQPNVITSADKMFFIWDLDSYGRQNLRLLLKRLSNSYAQLVDLQNRIGDLELDAIGDSWRWHSISQSTELFQILGSVESLEDFSKVKQELVRKLDSYLAAIRHLGESLGVEIPETLWRV